MMSKRGILALVLNAVLSASVALAAGPRAAESTQLPSTKKVPSQALWVTNFYYVSEFQGRALTRSGHNAPRIAFGSTTFLNPQSLAFDGAGNLWISYRESPNTFNVVGSVIELTPKQLDSIAHHRRVAPQVILADQGPAPSPFLGSLNSIAFDSFGDLWVADYEGQQIFEFKPDQITHSGGPTPAITFSSLALGGPAIRFDPSGNLWIITDEPTTTLYELTPAEQQAGGVLSPNLTVVLPQLRDVGDLVFDSSGNLWLPGMNSSGQGTIEMFRAVDISGSGTISPVPAATITSSDFGVNWSGPCIGGIEFDSPGDLWVANGSSMGNCPSSTIGILEFAAGELASGGNLAPSVAIKQKRRLTNSDFPRTIRFGPPLN